MFKDLKSYNKDKLLTDLGQGGIIAMSVFPLVLAFGANSQIGVVPALFSAVVIGSVMSLFCGGRIYSPALLSFIVFSEILSIYGWGTALISTALAGVLLILLAQFEKVRIAAKIPEFIFQGFLLGVTVDMAILQITNYFDIGASGATAVDMLISYKTVGFHSNWRTVLFSTIMLVVMITYPKKYKKFSKIVSAPFFGIVITAALNLFLNPDVEDTNVVEVGPITFDLLGKNTLFGTAPDIFSVQSVIICSLVLAFIINAESFWCDKAKKQQSRTRFVKLLYCFWSNAKHYLEPKAQGSTFSIIYFIFVAASGKHCKLPISACNCLKYQCGTLIAKDVKRIFSGKRLTHGLIFFAAVILTVLVDLTLTVAIIMVISIVLNLCSKKAKAADK
jgi:MFS superfamily sulfate permease-like transporter